MTTIRVTPIGGEPVELPEDTACTAAFTSDGASLTVRAIRENASGVRLAITDERHARKVESLGDFARAGREAVVHIGDAWPLCTVETWRQRAERLERELEAVQRLLAFAEDVKATGAVIVKGKP